MTPTLLPDASLNGEISMAQSAPNEGALNVLRQLRRAVEDAGHSKHPRIREAMDEATIVLGRGY